MFRTCLIAAFLTMSAAASAQETGGFVRPPLSDMQFGVHCDVAKNGSREEPGTVSGIINLIDQHQTVDVVTQIVPAELGISFGIGAWLDAESEPLLLEVVVSHPPMGENGQEVEIWSAPLDPGEPAVNLFTFEKPFEMVEGPWRFQLRKDDEVLLEQNFLVTPPGTVPAVQNACFSAMIMS
ncbi:DUF3859 domain-containing protein [Sagittula stellata]|uniref:DUF3859 domain-containing protein n=1 Tax=Sagittula stellata (strain ATCC 700073 / DSM 11524 / E-37) TaxID=388399 RepID=A3JX60_SAGS3|nr:DUF3859 domain-containing protein [Sagittula stellata]EBA10096.1 hypothetical protein SSE37_18862 [Sagittula stellata E-37]